MAIEMRVAIRNLFRGAAFALLALPPAAVCAAPAVPAQIAPDQVRLALQDCLTNSAPTPNVPRDKIWDALKGFYQARNFQPVWTSNPAAEMVLAALQDASADGLNPGRYHGAALLAHGRPSTPADVAQYDIMLTDGLLRYARDMHWGRVDPGQVDNMVSIERAPFDVAASLAATLSSGTLQSWLADLAPPYADYRNLKIALKRYREIVAQGGWPTVPSVRKIELKAGNPDLVALQARLAAEDPQIVAGAPVDIVVLEAAVERFQSRNGLAADGVVGHATILALNTSASDRLDQIQANMERWRWLPHEFGLRYIAVNTAATTLKVVDQGKVVLTSRVINGKEKTPTPIFNTKVVAITVNPSWNVPASIARNEILPKVRRNPGYLAKHHMVVADGRIRQLPGADNALGYIKLEMPNEFSSYLHDTASRQLFAKEDRHLSHGCMRVENIRPLASFVLTGEANTESERIDAAIETGQTQKIALDKPVPVYVLYWTAVAQSDGTVDFYPDVYGRDKKLIAAFAGLRLQDTASLSAIGCRGWTG